MRLDHFLPFLRKPQKGRAARVRRRVYDWARRVLPAALFSDPGSKRQGLVRRSLTLLGPSWHAAPWRRGVQVLCFGLFLWFFFHVCWPYSARPSDQWKGWIPLEVNVESGRVTLAVDGPIPEGVETGNALHVADTSAADTSESYLGVFVVKDVAEDQVELVSLEERTVFELEEMSFSVGPWTLATDHPQRWPSHYADDFSRKENIPVDTFLIFDPLVSISTAIAAKSWVWSLAAAGVILLVCVLIPRGFCGYLCPLGTLIDFFDWAIGKRVKAFQVSDDGWWVHIKYFLLAGVLIAAVGGVLISGLVAAIPVITRGLLFILAPVQVGMMRGWHQVPSMNLGHWLSISLFLGVLALGFLKPRFWCKYVCPSGAVFSLGNLFRVSERKVEESCIHCNRCVEVCPFDAIKPDFTTRTTDCTLCQTCGGVCPTHAIKFVARSDRAYLKLENDPPTGETTMGRRGFLASGIGAAAGIVGGLGSIGFTKTMGAKLDDPEAWRPVRPPGSVPEQEFLQLCIRCGECFKVCPNDVLQPMGFEQGFEGLWTPQMVANWAGCEPSCNSCGQVCPTGAIRAIPLDEKRVARMGLAIVNEATCLPIVGEEACQLCVDECVAAGYDAIEFYRVHTATDEGGNPIEGSGFLAPKVIDDRCVGCGLCQTRCYAVNAKDRGVLEESAIIIEAGSGKEDRILEGSYLELRRSEAKPTGSEDSPQEHNVENVGGYLPDFLMRKENQNESEDPTQSD